MLISTGSLSSLPDIRFIDSIPPEEHVFEPFTLFIVDDMLSGSELDENAKRLRSYFCRRCHHEKIYCLVTVQNLFSPNEHFRTIALNSNYLVLFRTNRGLHQLKFLSTQQLGKGDLLPAILRDVVRRFKFGYLLADFHPQTDPRLLFTTNLFGEGGEPCVAYVEKDHLI
ncbi:MAG TPA: hypothetical protein VMZ26_09280 [Pyrinomonadaceae bacterium]|nr:hypothetical protein [Pyrinomonadaceae bacterium]